MGDCITPVLYALMGDGLILIKNFEDKLLPRSSSPPNGRHIHNILHTVRLDNQQEVPIEDSSQKAGQLFGPHSCWGCIYRFMKTVQMFDSLNWESMLHFLLNIMNLNIV